MSVLKITRGRQKTASRNIIYGVEGIGKTTLAAQFPNPLFLDTEEGTKHLDCARVSIPTWNDLTLAMKDLAIHGQGFETVVIDSADWAEKLLVEDLLKNSGGKKSIEDFGFGKGYVMLQEHMTRFLASADVLVSKGMHVVFVAHSKVQRTSPPDQTDGYDRYELKLTKQVAPLLKEWCDVLLFCHFKTRLVDGADGRKKATGGKTRVMYAERSAAWDAKNRYGLPEEMPMSIDQLGVIFQGPGPAAPAKPLWKDRVAAADTIEALELLLADADSAHDAGQLNDTQLAKLTDSIVARRSALEPAEATA
jgi:hypothetical protein